MTPDQHSMQLIDTLLKMEVETTKTEAKMQLVQMSRDLMPAGKPSFLNVIKYPKISQMAMEHGSSKMIKVIFLMGIYIRWSAV